MGQGQSSDDSISINEYEAYQLLCSDVSSVLMPFYIKASNVPIHKLLTKLSRPQYHQNYYMEDTAKVLARLNQSLPESIRNTKHQRSLEACQNFGDVRLYDVDVTSPWMLAKGIDLLLGGTFGRKTRVTANLGDCKRRSNQCYTLISTAEYEIILSLDSITVEISYIPSTYTDVGCDIWFDGELMITFGDAKPTIKKKVMLTTRGEVKEQVDDNRVVTPDSPPIQLIRKQVSRSTVDKQILDLVNPLVIASNPGSLNILPSLMEKDSFDVDIQIKGSVLYSETHSQWRVAICEAVLINEPGSIDFNHKQYKLEKIVFNYSEAIVATAGPERLTWQVNTNELALVSTDEKLEETAHFVEQYHPDFNSKVVISSLQGAVGTRSTTCKVKRDESAHPLQLLVDPAENMRLTFTGMLISRIYVHRLTVNVFASESSISTSYEFNDISSNGFHVLLGKYRAYFYPSYNSYAQSIEVISGSLNIEPAMAFDIFTNMELNISSVSNEVQQILKGMKLKPRLAKLYTTTMKIELTVSVLKVASDPSAVDEEVEEAIIELQMNSNSFDMSGRFTTKDLQIELYSVEFIPRFNMLSRSKQQAFTDITFLFSP